MKIEKITELRKELLKVTDNALEAERLLPAVILSNVIDDQISVTEDQTEAITKQTKAFEVLTEQIRILGLIISRE